MGTEPSEAREPVEFAIARLAAQPKCSAHCRFLVCGRLFAGAWSAAPDATRSTDRGSRIVTQVWKSTTLGVAAKSGRRAGLARVVHIHSSVGLPGGVSGGAALELSVAEVKCGTPRSARGNRHRGNLAPAWCHRPEATSVPASARGGRRSLTGDEASSTTPRQACLSPGARPTKVWRSTTLAGLREPERRPPTRLALFHNKDTLAGRRGRCAVHARPREDGVRDPSCRDFMVPRRCLCTHSVHRAAVGSCCRPLRALEAPRRRRPQPGESSSALLPERDS